MVGKLFAENLVELKEVNSWDLKENQLELEETWKAEKRQRWVEKNRELCESKEKAELRSLRAGGIQNEN